MWNRVDKWWFKGCCICFCSGLFGAGRLHFLFTQNQPLPRGNVFLQIPTGASAELSGSSTWFCSWKICLKLFHSFQKFSTGRKPSLSMLFTPACLARRLRHSISLCPKTFLLQWIVGTTCTRNWDFNINVSWIHQQPSNFSLNHCIDCNDSKHPEQNLCFELH